MILKINIYDFLNFLNEGPVGPQTSSNYILDLSAPLHQAHHLGDVIAVLPVVSPDLPLLQAQHCQQYRQLPYVPLGDRYHCDRNGGKPAPR